MNCPKCGAPLPAGAIFCARCGAPVQPGQQPNHPGATPPPPSYNQPPSYAPPRPKYVWQDETASLSPQEIQGHKGMAVLSYLGVLMLIPLLMDRGNRFTRFHLKQSLLVLLVHMVTGVVGNLLKLIRVPMGGLFTPLYWGTPAWVGFLVFLLAVPGVILTIFGIVHAAQGRARALPVLDKLHLFDN